MARFNVQQRKIEIKIVFYGPAFSGKTTNVHRLHGLIPDIFIGELSALSAEDERTLFFDYFPVHSAGVVEDFQLQVEIFSVPGQAHYRATRHMVLQNVDGVIFVADSQTDQLENNLASLEDLKTNLRSYGRSFEDCPMVFQYNKQDLPNIQSIETMEKALNPRHLPFFEGIATQGKGVVLSFNAVVDQVKARLARDIPELGSRPGATLALASTENASAPVRTVAEWVARIGALGEHRPGDVASALSHIKGAANRRVPWGDEEPTPPEVAPLIPPGGSYDLQDAEQLPDGRVRLFFQDTLDEGGYLEFFVKKEALMHIFAPRLRPRIPSGELPIEGKQASGPGLNYLILIWLTLLSVWLLLGGGAGG